MQRYNNGASGVNVAAMILRDVCRGAAQIMLGNQALSFRNANSGSSHQAESQRKADGHALYP